MSSNPLMILGGRATIHIGNVMDRLRDLPDDFFDTCITSPPYWGLRDYGTAAWVGGDPECHHQPIATTRMPWANSMKSPTSAGKHGWHEARPPKERHGYCAVMQPSSPNTHARVAQDVDGQVGSERAHAGSKANGNMKAVVSKIAPAHLTGHRANQHFVDALKAGERKSLRGGTAKHVDPRHKHHVNHTGLDTLDRGQGRLLRNFEEAPVTVWPIATVAFKDAHFATFPPELVALAIAAGAPPDGGMVLDPFGGSGTTALVALRMGRRAHLIELKPDYADMARKRLERDWMGDDERKRAIAKDKGTPPPGPLFETPKEAAE